MSIETGRGNRRGIAAILLPAFCLGIAQLAPARSENIDPLDDGSQYAYAENVGWVNAEPGGNGGPGVQVGGGALTGWMWGENTGWISLSCTNTESCDSVPYGVNQDNCGTLGSYAWAENVGWLNFAPAIGGVLNDPVSGEFGGAARGENIGWVVFRDEAPLAYGVSTAWCRYAPTALPYLALHRDTRDLLLAWSAVPDADGYHVFQGSLTALIASSGDFASSTQDCRSEDQTATTHQQPLTLGTGADFFLVRAVNCGGNGSCDSGGSAQSGFRDAELASSGTCQ